MIALSTLLPSLVIDLPGCPTNMITQNLRRFVREFCRETSVWHEDLAAIESVADQADYTLTSTYATATINRVSSVAVEWSDDDLKIDQFSVDLRAALLTLNPPPSNDGDDITPHVVYLPLMTNTELPDFIMGQYQDAIIYGTLAKLQAMAGEHWANPTKARTNYSLYEYELNGLLIDEMVEGQPGDIVMQVGNVL